MKASILSLLITILIISVVPSVWVKDTHKAPTILFLEPNERLGVDLNLEDTESSSLLGKEPSFLLSNPQEKSISGTYPLGRNDTSQLNIRAPPITC